VCLNTNIYQCKDKPNGETHRAELKNMNYNNTMGAILMGGSFAILEGLMLGLSTWIFGSGVTIEDKINEWSGGQ
jgi:hypothetical protein